MKDKKKARRRSRSAMKDAAVGVARVLLRPSAVMQYLRKAAR